MLKMVNKGEKGYFITLYGVNNLGKTTQALRLVDWLNFNGYRSEYMKYPVYDLKPTGPAIKKQIKGKNGQTISEAELQLLFSQNRRDYEPTLIRKLDRGITVVAEDYTGTGIAWGLSKGLNRAFLDEINRDLLKENLAILFYGNRFTQAIEKYHVHENNPELIDIVCAKNHDELGKELGWKRIHANQAADPQKSINKVFNNLVAIVKREFDINEQLDG